MAAYTTIDNPELYFQVKLYTGTGSSLALTLDGDTALSPDMVWTKGRSYSSNHNVYDTVRGATKRVYPHSTSAENTDSETLKTFDSDGFTVGTQDNVNTSSETYVAWCWKAGTSFSNDASATSVGSVDSTGSINTDAGISIMSWTSLASGSNYTIAHGISTPHVIIMKGRHEANSWQVYHHKNTSAPETDYLDLSTNDATADYTVWNDTAPTSSVFSLGTWSGLDDGGTMIAYCFAEKQGYSKFGSFTGNGANNFIYTGFSPAWVMIKKTDDTHDWHIFDNKRDAYNERDSWLEANTSNAEATSSNYVVDFLSNGFKTGSGSGLNGSGETFIYMAFAEAPFVNSNGVPCNAR